MSIKKSGAILWGWGPHLKMWKVGNLRVRENPWKANLTIPGLSLENFDRNGNPQIGSLMQTAAMSLTYAFYQPYNSTGDTFMDWPKISGECFLFVSATELKLSRGLYDDNLAKWPLDVELSMGHIGGKSILTKNFLHSPDSPSDPLLTELKSLVCVDPKSHKPVPVPDWYKEKYQKKGTMDQGLFIKHFERPEKTFVYQEKVRWSDTDAYNHTSFNRYPDFAVNGIHACVLRRDSTADPPALPGISEAILANGLRNVQICYLSESKEGNKLDVHLWQEEGEDLLIRCCIESNGRKVCLLKLEYYDSLPSSKI